MEKFAYICLLLGAIGVLKEFRPSEPFVTKYLVQYKNFTKETIVQVAYPIGTYTHLGTLPLIFLITDLLRYKLIVILEGAAFVGCYSLLLWGEGLTNLKILEVLYGIAGSAEIAYYTYIYNKVDKKDYKKVTSYIHAAIIVGNLLAAIIAQTFVTFGVMDIRQLNFLTLGSTCLAFFLSLFLPPIKRSMYFGLQTAESPSIFEEQQLPIQIECENFQTNNTSTRENQNVVKMTISNLALSLKYCCPLMWKHFTFAYSNNHVLKWSIWWAIASAGYFQIVNYVQALWIEINEGSKVPLYNGATDAIHRSLSAILAIAAAHANIRWSKWGETLLTVFSVLQGLNLIIMSQTDNLFIAYGTYIFYRVSFQVMITIASAEVAQKILEDSYGLIFGINGFLAALIQTMITLAVTDSNGLALKERDQFVVYGCYHFCLGIFFACAVLRTIFWRKSTTPAADADGSCDAVGNLNGGIELARN